MFFLRSQAGSVLSSSRNRASSFLPPGRLVTIVCELQAVPPSAVQPATHILFTFIVTLTVTIERRKRGTIELKGIHTAYV